MPYGKTPLVLVVLVLGLSKTPAVAEAPESHVCPAAKTGQSVPFDNTTITFDSVPIPVSKDATQLTYCVKFATAAHDYLVDWNSVNLRGVFTRGGYLSTSLTIAGEPVVGASVAYIGANRTDFSLGILKQQTVKDAVEKLALRLFNWASSFHGSVSTVASAQPKSLRREKLQPVDLEFSSQQSEDGMVTLRFVNHAGENRSRIGFSPPAELARQNDSIPKNVTLTIEPGELHYKVDPASAVHKLVPLTLRNSDYQEIATVPVILVVDTERE